MNMNFQTEWTKHFYANRSVMPRTHDQEYDCLVECTFIDIGTCQFFALKDYICYLGRYDYDNGTVLGNIDVKQISIIQRKFLVHLNVFTVILSTTYWNHVSKVSLTKSNSSVTVITQFLCSKIHSLIDFRLSAFVH